MCWGGGVWRGAGKGASTSLLARNFTPCSGETPNNKYMVGPQRGPIPHLITQSVI